MGEMWSPEPAPSKLRRARKPRLRIPEANRGMTRHVLRRLMLALPTLWLVLASLLTRVVPGAPVERMPGEGATPFPSLAAARRRRPDRDGKRCAVRMIGDTR